MKLLSLLFVVLFTAQSFALLPHKSIKLKVLLENEVHVGFAPPGKSGKYLVQVLSNGAVVAIDNKENKTFIADLSIEALESLETQISDLKVGELLGEDGPGCMDAPSNETFVYRDGEQIAIKTVLACNKKEMYSARKLIAIMDGFVAISRAIQ